MVARGGTGNAEKIRAAILGGVGLNAAVVAIVMAFALGGAGHGWTSPLLPTLLAPITHPLAGVACAWGNRRWAWILAVALLILALAGDAAVYFRTRSEGFGYVEKVWNIAPGSVLVWAVTWFYGQALAVVTLLIQALRVIVSQHGR